MVLTYSMFVAEPIQSHLVGLVVCLAESLSHKKDQNRLLFVETKLELLVNNSKQDGWMDMNVMEV